MRTVLKTVACSDAIEVRVLCEECRHTTKPHFHDGKSLLIFVCYYCKIKYKLIIRPPCGCKEKS